VSAFQIKDSLEVQFSKAPCLSIAGPSGSGKTESAMRLMRGYCGKDKFVVVDTEEKRALYKKARYQPWDWVDFQPPFTPERYREVLEAVKHYKGVIIDSGSHEYSGPGGLQDIADEALERLCKGDYSKAEKLTAPSWKDAKKRHKAALMSYLIRYPTAIIFCLRAEPKIKFTKDSNGKTQIVDAGYQPICEKMFMYEMLVGCMMTADNAGVPMHIKQLEKDLEPIFLQGKQIDEGTGERLAAWAAERRDAGPAPLTEGQVGALIATLDVKTLPELKTAFEAAWPKTKGDTAARQKLQSNYDTMKAAIQAGTI
jgi:energy-coupling factor transporter ATP-binding protein EcfA2